MFDGISDINVFLLGLPSLLSRMEQLMQRLAECFHCASFSAMYIYITDETWPVIGCNDS